MSVVGAVSYSITFDPMTRTEANDDFVRFCKVRMMRTCIALIKLRQMPGSSCTAW